jgi:hypothetical protein
MGTMALLSLRLQQPGEPPPRRRVKPPISCLSLPMTSKLLSHSPLAHSSSKAFRLSGFHHSSLLSIININIYSSRIILSSSCLSIRHLYQHQPHLLSFPKTSPTIDFRNQPSHRSLPNTRSHQASPSAAFPQSTNRRP